MDTRITRSLATAALFVLPALAATAQPAARTRTFRFTYRAVVRDVPPGAGAIDVWVPFPQSDVNQTIRDVSVHAPGPVTIGREPGHGNQAVYFHQDHPTGPVEITLDVVAIRRENAGEREVLTPEEARRYLGPEPLVPIDGPVRQVALEATKGKKSDVEKARGIYEKVTGMMKYDKTGSGWGRGDAVFACDAKRGNCTDFHALVIGAARSVGIPARFAIGFPLPAARGRGDIPGYHCWAELYVKGQGWVPVDSSEGSKALALGDVEKKNYYFGHHDENRIEFSRGRNLVLEPPQKGSPLNFFVYPYAEIDGKPVEKVDRKFAFEDLSVTTASAR